MMKTFLDKLKLKKVLLLLAVLISCQNKQEFEYTNIIEFRKHNANEFHWKDSTTFICLDVTDNEAIFNEIGKVIIQNDLIYIGNFSRRGANKVLCFDSEGTFVRSYGHHGRGPGDYGWLSDFDVNLSGEVFLYSRQGRKVIHYCENNILRNEYNLDFRADGFKLLEDGNFFFAMANFNTDNSLFCIYNPVTKEEQHFLEFDKNDKSNYKVRNAIQHIPGGFIAYIPIRDYFMVFDKSGNLQETVKFDFGKNTMPERLKFDAFLWPEKPPNNHFFLNFTPVKFDNYIIGEFGSFTEGYTYLFDKQEQKLFTNKIDRYNFSHKGLYPVLGVFDDKIISSIDFDIYEASIDKEELPRDVIDHVTRYGIVLTFSKLSQK